MRKEDINKRLKNLIMIKRGIREEIEKNKCELNELERQLGLKKTEVKINSKNFECKCKEIEVSEKSEDEKKAYIKKREKLSDLNYESNIDKLIKNIPSSNGSRYYKKLDITIGIVADEFLYNSFKDAGNFIYITYKNYKEVADKIDLLFVASTWNGLNKEWCGVATEGSKLRKILLDTIKYYKEKGIKTVFYSKEDPINYNIYLDYAKVCDYIFTTEKDVVEDYKRDCKNDNVSVLNFGINPIYHNPIGFRNKNKFNDVLFAGSWYEKYPERNSDAQMILDGIIEGGRDVKIIDRNFELNNSRYFFPEKYLKYISPSLKHDKLQKVHKLYDFAINLNTIKYSPTMFANRVYELQALGNIIFSNYSIGINNKFPNVFLINNKEEAKYILDSFDDKEIYKHQVLGIRNVMSKETTFDRINQLCEEVGLTKENSNKKVLVVCKKINNKIREMFNLQSYQDKELITMDKVTEKIKSKYEMIAFFEENKQYGMFYLEDMINAFKYTDSDFITKDSYYNGDNLINGIEHNFISKIGDAYRTVIWSDSFTLDEIKTGLSNVKDKKGYSIDPFEFNNKVTNKTNKIINKKEYKLSVIIAAYNNGDHLLNKCFESLRRSTMFNEMEIIIVDDGSTDGYTPKIAKYIENNYSNVRTYCYNDGGSGSASRPRNKGFEMSTSKYITYLDPDNEAINDGYKKLYDEIKKDKYDLVIGGMLKVDTSAMKFNYNNVMRQHNKMKNELINDDNKAFLERTNYYVQSIQALVLNKDLITENKLEMIEGVFGEDTLFFQELIISAKRINTIPTDIHVYYAAVEGSSVNNITKKFYERYLVLEKLRIEKYKRYDMLKGYIAKRFDFYVTKWYFEKLKKINKEEEIEAIKVIEEILDLYTPYTEFKNELINRFYTLCKEKKYDEVKNEFIG